MVGLMRVILEKHAKLAGLTVLEHFILPNGEVDYHKARDILDKYFRMKPTGVYWSDKKVRDSEINQIDESRLNFFNHLVGGEYTSIPLNYDDGGGGPPSSVGLAPKIGLYLGMGLSVPKIYDLFKKIGLIRRTMHYETFKNFVKDLFGSMENAYKEFTEGTIGLFEEAGYASPYIYDEYKHYFSKVRYLFIPATLDVPNFLTYTKSGYNIKSVATLLKLSSLQLRELSINYIDENFKEIDSSGNVNWLIPITSNNGKKHGRPFFEDLQNYLIAPIALYYHFEGLSLEKIASLFKHSPYATSGYKRKYISRLFRNYFHTDIASIDYLSSLQEMKDIVLHFDPVSLSALGNQFSLSYATFISRVQDFVVNKKEGFNIIDQLKISIIGPLLYNLYKVGQTPTQIAKHNAFFWEGSEILNRNDPNYNLKLGLAIQKVILYTQLIFRCAPYQVTSNFLSADDYRERFGVIPFNI